MGSNNRKLVLLLSICFCLFFYSCENKKQKINDSVFVDREDIVHADKKCKSINGRIIKYSIKDKNIFDIAWRNTHFERNICNKCVNDSTKKELKHSADVYIEEKVECKNEYLALCLLNDDRWGSFEKYYEYINKYSNYNQLIKEFHDNGYSFSDLRGLIWLFDNEYEFNEKDIHVNLNVNYTMWLCAYLHIFNEYNGDYVDFKQMLYDKDGFIWCYEKCLEYKIVSCWKDFIMLIFEPDCDYCKDMYMNEYEE